MQSSQRFTGYRATGRVVTDMVLAVTFLGLLSLAAPATAAPASVLPRLSLGPLEAVPGMQSGLPPDQFGIAVLGTLGKDLYLFGSQSETTGAIQGVWRHRNGTWTKLGETRLDLFGGVGADYNRLAAYGAVEYKGHLYIGDRRIGNLYKLLLNRDGSFKDVVVAAKVGNEDVFPGPVWQGKLVLGTFGAYTTGENAGVYTYDGTVVTKRLDLSVLGNAGQVTSIVPYGKDLWVTAIDRTASWSQIWKLDKQFKPTLVYSGVEDHRLVTSGSDLYSVRGTYPYPYETHAFTKWDGTRFVPMSEEYGFTQFPALIGAMNVRGAILDLSYFNGIFGFSGGTVQLVLPGRPAMGSPFSVKEHGGYLWIVSNQPVGLYRAKIL